MCGVQDPPVLLTWGAFLLVSAVIVVAGTELARQGDAIAEKTGMGQTWVGMVLVAATTSLPELFIGVGASAVHRLPDLALGDVLGSCMFNLLILSLMDLVGGRTPLSARAHQGHALAIGFGVALVALVALELALVAGRTGAVASLPPLPTLGWWGAVTPLLLVGYLLAIRLSFLYERRRALDVTLGGALAAARSSRGVPAARYRHLSLARVLVRYGLAALLVVGAALLLPQLGETLARESGLGQALVGNLFLATTSSLPEVVVALAAVRLGAVHLAFGNVLGSNLFNFAILALDDLLYLPGPLLAAVHPSHLVSALAVVLMYASLLVGVSYQALRKQLVLAWDTAVIAMLYLVAVALLFWGR